jgi:hypothetical protein
VDEKGGREGGKRRGIMGVLLLESVMMSTHPLALSGLVPFGTPTNNPITSNIFWHLKLFYYKSVCSKLTKNKLGNYGIENKKCMRNNINSRYNHN